MTDLGHRLAVVVVGEPLEGGARAGRHLRRRVLAQGAELGDGGLERRRLAADLVLGDLCLLPLGLGRLPLLLLLGLELLDLDNLGGGLLLDAGLLGLLGVDLAEERLVLLVILGLLLLEAEVFDVLVAVLQVAVEFHLLGTGVLELVDGSDERLFRELGPLVLDADAARDAVELVECLAEVVVGLEEGEEGEVGRSHSMRGVNGRRGRRRSGWQPGCVCRCKGGLWARFGHK